MPSPSPSPYNSRAVRLGRQLQADLRRGRFKAGERLPTEQELAATYQVSRSTLRRTITRLVTAGGLIKTPWHGVRVPGEAASSNGAASRQIAWVTAAMSGEAEEYARGLQNVLAPTGFTLGLYCSQANPARFHQLLEHLIAMHPAGIVLQQGDQWHDEVSAEKQGKRLSQAGIPMVCMDSEDNLNLACDRVWGAPYHVGRVAARYLVEKNYRDLTFLSECPEHDHVEVMAGLRDILTPAGITLPDERVLRFQAPRGYSTSPDPFIDAETKMKELLAAGFRRGTLISGHDYPATGMLRAVLAAGLRVPEEVQIISLLRCHVNGAAPMRLTTIENHREEKGYMAGRLLLRRIAGYTGPVEVLRLATDELIPGETG
ncbi:MAG: GntR family transcriptional regulator [Lentisphaeria bacterium]